MLPGEIRVWQRSLAGINPETVNLAFEEYYKHGQFPPKPVDIVAKVQLVREAIVAKRQEENQERLDYQAIEASRNEYFKSDEYKEFLARMKAKGL